MQNYFGIAIRTYNQDGVPAEKSDRCCFVPLFGSKRFRDTPYYVPTRCLTPGVNMGNPKTMEHHTRKRREYQKQLKALLRPIFDNFAEDELLAKCLHGKTQNNNEALNSLVWKRVPKGVFVGRYIVEIGVSSAVIHFNDGVTGMKQVFSSLELTPGKHFFAVCTCK